VTGETTDQPLPLVIGEHVPSQETTDQTLPLVIGEPLPSEETSDQILICHLLLENLSQEKKRAINGEPDRSFPGLVQVLQ
jgi:hypothetical protein